MIPTIGFDPLLPYPQILFLAILATGLAVWLYLSSRSGDSAQRRAIRRLSILRALGVYSIVALLLNPVFTHANHSTDKPPLLILIDKSHSMATRDLKSGSRFDAAKEATLQNADLLRQLENHYNCMVFGMADTAVHQDVNSFLKTAKADGTQTCLGESVANAVGSVSDAQSGGVLLVSDGRNNGQADPVEAARQARARRFPVFTMCFGTVNQGRDASLLNRRPQIFAAPQQEAPLSAEVRSVGYTGQSAQIDLVEGGKTLETKTITLDDHHPATVLFSVHQDKEGVYPYTMTLRGMPGEVTLSNNKSTAYLQVLKSKARVLVLEGRPSWDAKFLIQAMHTDPSIEVDSIFKLTGDKTFAVAGTDDTASAQKPREITVPKTAADFAKYDVVVIGKGYEDFFTPQSTEALKTFVSDHSGNVIFLRGNPGKQTGNLSALEPLQWSADEIQDVRMKVTDEGKRNPAFNFSATPNPDLVIQKLPTLISATKVDGEKSLAVVLARASGVPSGSASQEMAMIAYQNYGQGKAVSVVGEGLWRWALLPPDMKDYGGCYNDFWTQLIRWLVNQSDFLPGQDLSLKTDKTSYSPNQPISLMAFVRGKAKSSVPPVTINMPNGQTAHVTLAKGGSTQANFVGSFKAQIPGEYTAWLGRPNGSSLMVPFSVFPSNEEDLVTASDPEMMRQIAEAGGGDMLNAGDLSQLPLKLKDSLQVISRKTDSQSAWDRAPILAFLLAIFTIEWILRRRSGLL